MSVVRRSLTAVALTLVLTAGLFAQGAHAAPTVTHGIYSSFDDTPIAYTLFRPEAPDPAPVVFMTHGWGQRRATAASGLVATLLDDGYAVFTWDQRGFGDSGDVAHVNSQEFEVKDVRGMISFVAEQDGILLDAPGDPRMGMVGNSYAGGIQLMTASADDRIDAIAPQIAWNDLPRALRPNGVLKLAWDLALYGAGAATGAAEGLDSPAGPQTGVYDDKLHDSLVEGAVDNDWSAETVAWFDARSPKHYINGATLGDGTVLPGISAPTLLVQGLNDTLFPINHAIANARQIEANGAEVKMVFFCGLLVSPQASHSMSLNTSCADGDQGEVSERAILDWFAKHIKGQDVDTGPRIEYATQDGTFHGIEQLPTQEARGLTCPTGEIRPRCNGEAEQIVGGPAPTSGSHALGTPAPGDSIRFQVKVPEGATALGVPTATLSLAGIGEEARIFIRLIDVSPEGVETVINDQVTAGRTERALGSSSPQNLQLDLNGVAWRVAPGHRIVAEITSSSYDHANSRTPFVAAIDASVDVPYVR